MTAFKLTVYGDPAPQGSKRHVGNGRMIEASKKVGPWRRAVAEAVLFQYGHDLEPFDCPLEIETIFFLPRPSTVKRPLPIVPPDLDKLERGLFDSLTIAGVWRDDSLVIKSTATKFYADLRDPGCEVEIRVIDFVPIAIDTPRKKVS
jgi:crossover junction endodeoxyribonuclease RusA